MKIKFKKLLGILIYGCISIGFSMFLLSKCQQKSEDKTPWINLFDGETLKGWIKLGGNATYNVEDGVIVGTSTLNTPNTFLRTKDMYSDFILEVEFKVDEKLNSGIQIRSNSIKNYRNGKVHGYQVEIDPSKRAWSAGIYDEQRRGWLYTLDNNTKAQKAFKQNDWNHYRIEGIGDTLKTWINNVPASYLIDDFTKEGFIALQVHAIDNKNQKDIKVTWKNIKIITENLDKYTKKSTLKPLKTINTLTFEEQKNNWKLLWDGKTTEGWRGAKLETFPKVGWEINNGILSVLSTGGGESEAGGDIVTEKKYGDFELKVDFKLTEGANSGIKYYVDTELNQGKGSSIGLEFQILDDARHPDAKLGNHKGSRTVSSLYDLIQADTSKVVNPIGEWNHAHIISKNNHVEHWLNGMKVLEYERKSPEYRKLVSESKYKVWPNFGEADNGRILLQDHGDRVSFRNIKIRPLNTNNN